MIANQGPNDFDRLQLGIPNPSNPLDMMPDVAAISVGTGKLLSKRSRRGVYSPRVVFVSLPLALSLAISLLTSCFRAEIEDINRIFDFRN
ncbi:hypothetical protein L6452_22208 [Arctium lappa]|uniref:Uncharacterized protein n=1 Tax=Arctium lappa TaxID=4217 RepID=A0ACB9AZ59_ARCLA|nr:hypothetical protein L6452_22208 [Arctium lappa]